MAIPIGVESPGELALETLKVSEGGRLVIGAWAGSLKSAPARRHRCGRGEARRFLPPPALEIERDGDDVYVERARADPGLALGLGLALRAARGQRVRALLGGRADARGRSRSAASTARWTRAAKRGHLVFRDVRGPIDARTSGGSIDVSGCRGDVDVATSRGSMRSGCRGQVSSAHPRRADRGDGCRRRAAAAQRRRLAAHRGRGKGNVWRSRVRSPGSADLRWLRECADRRRTRRAWRSKRLVPIAPRPRSAAEAGAITLFRFGICHRLLELDLELERGC